MWFETQPISKKGKRIHLYWKDIYYSSLSACFMPFPSSFYKSFTAEFILINSRIYSNSLSVSHNSGMLTETNKTKQSLKCSHGVTLKTQIGSGIHSFGKDDNGDSVLIHRKISTKQMAKKSLFLFPSYSILLQD